MKSILLFIFVIIHSNLFAQTYAEIFTVCNKSYNTICEFQIDESIQITVKDGLTDTNKMQYKLRTNDLDQFAITFTERFQNSISPDTICNEDERKKLVSFARKLYFNFIAFNTQDTILTVAGILKLRDSAQFSFKYNTKDSGKVYEMLLPIKFQIQKMQAEINEGYIENMKVYIKLPNGIHYFSLPYPVGISSVGNFRKYASTKLFETGSSPFLKKVNKKDYDSTSHQIVDSQYYVFLSDIIDYDYYFAVSRRDYSPQNIAIDLIGGNSLVLHKERTDKLFEVDIFTDFQGLNENRPNGLIQAELSKRININTIQFLSQKWILYWLFGSYGYFQYIAPSVVVSKLEQHNKILSLFDLDSVKLNPGGTDTSLFSINYHRYASALSLYQYQWFSAGADLNLYYINNHEYKFNIYLNVGARLAFTKVSDSLTSINSTTIVKTGLVSQYSVTSIYAYPEIRMNFLPEERFNFSLSHKWIYYKPLSPTVQLVSYDKNNSTIVYPKTFSWLNTSELLMTILVNPKIKSKLFGRILFNWEAGNMKNNFSQIQIGYSTYILGDK